MKRSQYSREMGEICPLGSLILAALVFICFVCSLHRECTRGGFCNFMHLKPISRELRRELYGRRRKRYKLCMSGTSLNLRMFHILSRFPNPLLPHTYSRIRSRSRSRDRRSRSRDRDRDRDRGRGGGRDHERRRSRDRERSGRF